MIAAAINGLPDNLLHRCLKNVGNPGVGALADLMFITFAL